MVVAMWESKSEALLYFICIYTKPTVYVQSQLQVRPDQIEMFSVGVRGVNYCCLFLLGSGKY